MEDSDAHRPLTLSVNAVNLGTVSPLPLDQVGGSPCTVTGTIHHLEMKIDPKSYTVTGQVGTGTGTLEVENKVPKKKEIGAKIEHQRRQKKKDRKRETEKNQREGEVGLGNLTTTPRFLKNQVNFLGVYELSLLVLIKSVCLSLSLSLLHTHTHLYL